VEATRKLPVGRQPFLIKFAVRSVCWSYYRRVWRTLDHFAIEQGHRAFPRGQRIWAAPNYRPELMTFRLLFRENARWAD